MRAARAAAAALEEVQVHPLGVLGGRSGRAELLAGGAEKVFADAVELRRALMVAL